MYEDNEDQNAAKKKKIPIRPSMLPEWRELDKPQKTNLKKVVKMLDAVGFNDMKYYRLTLLYAKSASRLSDFETLQESADCASEVKIYHGLVMKETIQLMKIMKELCLTPTELGRAESREANTNYKARVAPQDAAPTSHLARMAKATTGRKPSQP